MSKKSNNPSSGSLDMLLDAMSNAFGSIVLICILLVINLSNKTDEIVDKVEQELVVEKNEPYFRTQSEMKDENADLEIDIEELKKIDLESVLAEKQAAEILLKEKMQMHAEILESLKSKSTAVKIKKIDTADFSANIDILNRLNQENSALANAKTEKISNIISIKSSAIRMNATAPISASSMVNYVWVIIKDKYFIPLDFTTMQSYMRKDRVGNLHVLFDPSLAMSLSDFKMHLGTLDSSKVYLSFIVNADTRSYTTLREIITPANQRGFKYYWIPNIGGYLSAFSNSGLSPEGTY